MNGIHKILFSVGGLLLSTVCSAQDLRLCYQQPAEKWTEALPIGNGRLGAMIYGGVEEEHLQFNESTLWTGEPRAYQRADAGDYLDSIRALLFRGRQSDAEAMAEAHFMGKKDRDESEYARLKEEWIEKVRRDTAFARADWDDRAWKTMELPTPDGWEAAGLPGVDGAVWFRVRFDLPQNWEGRDVVLDLGRIRDKDFTYVNGVLVGSDEGISKKRSYRVKASLLKAHDNVIAIQVLNFDDKGGLIGLKGQPDLTMRVSGGDAQAVQDARALQGARDAQVVQPVKAVTLPHAWKYAIRDADPPFLPKYEAEYQPFGDLAVRVSGQGKASDYRRQLDIGDAIAGVSYHSGGVHFTREYFASAPQQVLAVHFGADRPGSIDLEARLGTPHRAFTIRRVDDRTLGLFVSVRDGVLKGVSYWRVEAVHGEVTVTADKIIVKGADEVIFYGAAATNFKKYNDVSGDAAAACKATLSALKDMRYSAIRSAHIREYRSYFDRFKLSFGAKEEVGGKGEDSVPTDERILHYSVEKDPGLIALYVQYGRYLLLSSSRPGSPYPANLQGLWNDDLSPPWGSKFTTNINLEMNYWPSEMLNLSDCALPLFRLTRDLSEAGRATAADYYKSRGWVLHHNTDLWCGTAPINAANHGIWPTGGAWLCHQIWEHYLFTGDRRFLRDYYPVMRSAAEFFVDFLIRDPRSGWLISTPSASPEHGGLVAGPTMDHQIIRDLFRNCAAAAAILGTDTAFRRVLGEKYGQIAPNQIGRFGQLQEWLEDKDDTTDTHRHISHLWGVYPGTDITWKDPAMMQAARQSLHYRGDDGTGWSLAWKVNCLARFREGDHALQLVDKLLSSAAGVKGGERGGVYPNLFDAHPPFQIDGNFGGAAGIAEMLIQSQDSVIDLLPAWPAALPEGEVRGLCARGGFELGLNWRKGVLQRVELLSRLGGTCTLRYGEKEITVRTQKGGKYIFDGGLGKAADVRRDISDVRRDISLNDDWHTVVSEKDSAAYRGFQAVNYDDRGWKRVSVPHNWDIYGGYRRLRHGNLHGYAWYRRRFVADVKAGRRYFLWFEGVGSYATVWVNGRKVGYHAGGRTSFTVDITDALRRGKVGNVVAVRADHPANIRDLPWVCGGCSDERGFSEGSQPMGIFRPVHLVMTSPTRVEPFGVHIWNDTTASSKSAGLYIETEVKNYGKVGETGILVQRLIDREGRVVAEIRSGGGKGEAGFVGAGNAGGQVAIGAGATVVVRQQLPDIRSPRLWAIGDPYLYELVTDWVVAGRLMDRVRTSYGIRVIRWPDLSDSGAHPFLLNGRPVFINGIAEYEHRLGDSHAFSDEEIKARVGQIRAAGFNAVRDAHQPHNLLYEYYWDSLGILWWPQLSAHIWFDSPVFRRNFKTLLTEWIKERRNSPAVVLWGLQNESKLPEDFARECSELIRQLDPTASSQRKITTCNGGAGSDWDVPQNWTGTYGGDPATYAADLRRQVLVGEYGAWRTADLHGDAANSEDRMARLMEMKIRLAESVKDQVAGHFAWLYSSHDNPGRVQSGEGWREMDRIGPVNYKGLLTSWEEPLDAYYLFRSNFVSPLLSPMLYIVSHSWPDRWTAPGKKDGIVVYSNCDEVELFNDYGGVSLGRRKRDGVGSHFQWDGVDIRFNVLYAVGYVGGKPVARDSVVLHHLPAPPGRAVPVGVMPVGGEEITAPGRGYHYLYRVNCGGPDYTDHRGNVWLADRHRTTPGTWGSFSWTDDYPGMPAFFASQRRVTDPIAGTAEAALFQDFRYGLDRLGYTFPVQDGDYRLELYFSEPWLGRGGGMDCKGWRLFDVAVNGKTVITDLDLWKAGGLDRAVKKVVLVHVTGGKLVLSFPRVAAGQAVIAALAIATKEGGMRPAAASPGWIAARGSAAAGIAAGGGKVRFWMDTGDTLYDHVTFSSLPPNLYGAEWVGKPKGNFSVTVAADVFIGVDTAQRPGGYEDTHTRMVTDAASGSVMEVYRRRYEAGSAVELPACAVVAVQPATTIEPAYDSKPVTAYKTSGARVAGDTIDWTINVGVGDMYSLTVKYRWLSAAAGSGRLAVRMEDGTLIREEPVVFSTTPAAKWNYWTGDTGTMVNAGRYKVRLIVRAKDGLKVDELQVQ